MCLMQLISLGGFNQFRKGVELQKGIAKNRLVTVKGKNEILETGF